MVSWRIKRGPTKILLLDQRTAVFAVLEDEELIIGFELCQSVQQMPSVPADTSGLMIDQPSIHTDAQRGFSIALILLNFRFVGALKRFVKTLHSQRNRIQLNYCTTPRPIGQTYTLA
jgi:hypothetical protein